MRPGSVTTQSSGTTWADFTCQGALEYVGIGIGPLRDQRWCHFFLGGLIRLMDQILRDNSATYFERVNMVFQLPCQIAATVGHYEIIQKSEECHNCRLEHRLSSESSRSWAILVSVTLLLKSLWRWRWWVIWLVGLVFLSAWFIILPANRMYGNIDESCVYILYIYTYVYI